MESLFKVVKIAGKGLGWIALREIKAGTLILKEKPQFVPKEVSSVCCDCFDHDRFESLMNAFFAMSLNDQKEFLELANKYLDLNSVNDEERKWYYEWKNYAENQNHFDSNLLLKIMCIHSTNSFEDNGPVGIKVSRINHSCCPNSQHMVTSSDGTAGQKI